MFIRSFRDLARKVFWVNVPVAIFFLTFDSERRGVRFVSRVLYLEGNRNNVGLSVLFGWGIGSPSSIYEQLLIIMLNFALLRDSSDLQIYKDL